MAKRLNVYRVDSSIVQGEGSFVEIRALTRDQAKEDRKELVAARDLSDDQQEEASDAWIASMVAGWDWVDDNGLPLPLPGTDVSVIGKLSIQELGFLVETIEGQITRKK